MDFRSAFSRAVGKRPTETQHGEKDTGRKPQDPYEGVRITVEEYPIAGAIIPLYEVSLTKDGKKVPISLVQFKRGGKKFLTTEFVDVPKGEHAYVLEVTDCNGNKYRPEPIAIQSTSATSFLRAEP